MNKIEYIGENVKLIEIRRTDSQTAYDGIPTIYYEIHLLFNDVCVGSIELRMSIEGEMYYYGHIGYTIKKQYRGNNYAYYACKVLFMIARNEFSMKELIITCSPNNIASYKTLLKLNGELIEEINVPEGHILYRCGETRKCVFKVRL